MLFTADASFFADASRRTPTIDSPVTRVRRRSLVAIGLVVALIIAGCGDVASDGGDVGGTVASDDASERAGPPVAAGEVGEGLGAAGHWTAAQLCSLIEVGTVSAAFPGIEVLEQGGLDEADWSVCSWDDAAIDPLEPSGALIRVANKDHDGETFCDCFDTIDVPGADQAVFAETLDSETRSAVLVAVADQSLTIEFPKADPDAREIAGTGRQYMGLLPNGLNTPRVTGSTRVKRRLGDAEGVYQTARRIERQVLEARTPSGIPWKAIALASYQM